MLKEKPFELLNILKNVNLEEQKSQKEIRKQGS